MRILNLMLVVVLLSGCSAWNTVFKPDPPKCAVVEAMEPVRPITRIAVFGDGFGEDRAIELAVMMQRACSTAGECHFGIYLGDVYPSGADDRESFLKKVMSSVSRLKFPVYSVIGNHEYRGDPQKYLQVVSESPQFRIPCNHYGISDDKTFTLMVLDTNHPKDKGQPDNVGRLCNEKGLKIAAAHHPLWSNAKKDRESEMKETREHFEEPLRRCADIYLAGHDHHQELIVKSDLVQVLSGGFGRNLRPVNKVGGDQRFIAEAYGFSILSIYSGGYTVEFFGQTGKLLYSESF